MKQLIIKFFNLFKKKKPSLKHEQFFDPRTIKLNLLKDPVDNRDFIFPAKLTQVDQLPDYIDLREWCTPIKQQGVIGSCSAFAAVSIIENIKNRMSKTKPTDKYAWDGSELYLYYNTRVDMTEEYKTDYINQDSGAYPRNVCKALQKDGMSLELYCPYDVQKFTQKPSWIAYFAGGSSIIKEYYKCHTINDIHNSLAKQLPVMTACQVYSNFMELRANEYNMIEGQYLGNHMMAIFGIDIKKRKILLRNSWSTIWGNQGYTWVDFDVFNKMSYDNWTLVPHGVNL